VPAFVWERLNDELPNDPEALVFPSRKGGHLGPASEQPEPWRAGR
jgi:hypothetical protein